MSAGASPLSLVKAGLGIPAEATTEIFIIDDSADNVAVLSRILRTAGYAVRTASTGGRALEELAIRPSQLVLMDINIPDVDGFAMCQALRAEPGSRDTPVVFLSALDNARNKVNAFRAGGVDYITKPFHEEEVLARVEHHLGLTRLRRILEERNRALEEKNRELTLAWGNADRLFEALSERLPGTRVDDRYRLEAQIGTGGSATVYRAFDETTGQRVAVKILRPQVGPHADQWRDRFLQEWGTSSVISHPSAVAFLDAGITSIGLPYLVMELLEGRTLADEMARNGTLSLHRIAQVMAPVCRMLAAAHEAGLIHRDIKPANIFLHRAGGAEGEEQVKVVDFGIAKLLERNDVADFTTMGRVIGTPLYMSAERLLGEACDGRADVFAVAVTCYEALTGRYPYPCTEETVQAAIFASLGAALSSPSSWCRDLPPPFETAPVRALSREPDVRPSMAELAELFESLLATPAPATNSSLPGDPGDEEVNEQPTQIAWPPDGNS
jgi:CheY-like chemotaxis protein